MRKFKYLLILVLSIGLLNSCLVDEETNYDENDTGLNLVTFELTKTLVSGIADGTEYTFPMKVKLIGPSFREVKNDITVTVAVDPSSTAIEGTHYRIDDPTIVLTAENNYLGLIYVSMTTAGIETPLPKNPKLVLKIQSAEGDEKVMNTGKLFEIEMNFACYTELEGVYNARTTNSSGGVRTYTETITKIDTETYLTKRVGTWAGPLNPDFGFKFMNSCNVISVPKHDLADKYSNQVYSHRPGELNQETGVITIYYTITFDAGDVTYTTIFTPAK